MRGHQSSAAKNHQLSFLWVPQLFQTLSHELRGRDDIWAVRFCWYLKSLRWEAHPWDGKHRRHQIRALTCSVGPIFYPFNNSITCKKSKLKKSNYSNWFSPVKKEFYKLEGNCEFYFISRSNVKTDRKASPRHNFETHAKLLHLKKGKRLIVLSLFD